MIDLNTCQPGQMMTRCDGLTARYIGKKANGRHWLNVYYDSGVQTRGYISDGSLCWGHNNDPSDIAQIHPMEVPCDYRWHAKVSSDRVEASSGFWAVYQGEA